MDKTKEKWTRLAILNELFERVRMYENELAKKGYASITAYINSAIAEKLERDNFK